MNFSKVKLPSNKKFGFFLAVVFGIMGSYLYIEKITTTSYICFTLCALFIVAAVIKADLLLPLNKLWMRFALLLSMIVNPNVLGVNFFGLFTPFSIFMRIFGRDELRLKFKNKKSYWIMRESKPQQNDTFKQQF